MPRRNAGDLRRGSRNNILDIGAEAGLVQDLLEREDSGRILREHAKHTVISGSLVSPGKSKKWLCKGSWKQSSHLRVLLPRKKRSNVSGSQEAQSLTHARSKSRVAARTPVALGGLSARGAPGVL